VAQLRSGVVTVTTAGTAVRMSATDLFVKKLIVRPAAANTGNIYIGNNGAGTVGISTGMHLEPADGPSVVGDVEIAGREDSINLKDVWVNSSVNGEQLTYLYLI